MFKSLLEKKQSVASCRKYLFIEVFEHFPRALVLVLIGLYWFINTEIFNLLIKFEVLK